MLERDSSRVSRKVLGVLVNTVFVVGVLIFVAFYADGFSVFQKLVVLLVALILYAATRSVIKILSRT